MLRFVISVEFGFDPNEVAELIRRVSPDNIKIIEVYLTKSSKRTSGIMLIECSLEVSEQIKGKDIKGIRHFEPEIYYHLP